MIVWIASGMGCLLIARELRSVKNQMQQDTTRISSPLDNWLVACSNRGRGVAQNERVDDAGAGRRVPATQQRHGLPSHSRQETRGRTDRPPLSRTKRRARGLPG